MKRHVLGVFKVLAKGRCGPFNAFWFEWTGPADELVTARSLSVSEVNRKLRVLHSAIWLAVFLGEAVKGLSSLCSSVDPFLPIQRAHLLSGSWCRLALLGSDCDALLPPSGRDLSLTWLKVEAFSRLLLYRQ